MLVHFIGFSLQDRKFTADFSTGKRRPARITFTDIPALLSTTTEDAYIAPWEDDVYQALTGSDIVFLVVRASSDPPTEQPEYYAGDYASDDHYDTSSQRAEFHGVVNDLFREHDLRTLTKLLKNEPFRYAHHRRRNLGWCHAVHVRDGCACVMLPKKTRYHIDAKFEIVYSKKIAFSTVFIRIL